MPRPKLGESTRTGDPSPPSLTGLQPISDGASSPPFLKWNRYQHSNSLSLTYHHTQQHQQLRHNLKPKITCIQTTHPHKKTLHTPKIHAKETRTHTTTHNYTYEWYTTIEWTYEWKHTQHKHIITTTHTRPIIYSSNHDNTPTTHNTTIPNNNALTENHKH